MILRALSTVMVLGLSLASHAASALNAQPGDLAYPRGLPSIGKWMIDQEGAIAHWLGERVDGRALREPINVIIVDDLSGTAQEATTRLKAASSAAGFPIRPGHSSGYRAIIGGNVFSQLPQEPDHAFSNQVAELTNDHGRLFGPYHFGTAYVFIGAFSREEVRLAQVPHHSFGSFNQGRDDYARSLDRKTKYKIADFVSLENTILGDPATTTVDHDGIAVLLRTQP